MKAALNSKYTAIAIIIAVSIGVYLNTLPNGFVYDDEFQVLKNLWIKDVRYLPEIFRSHVGAPFAGEFVGGRVANYYRPVMYIILMIDYYIFGLKPWGFHLINILFHAGVSVLFFLIAPLFFGQSSRTPEDGEGYKRAFALIAALLFSTHPVHTEAVAWVSGIPELSFTLFYLISFYLYIKAGEVWGKRSILSVIFFFLAALSKETALTLPILLLAYDYSLAPPLTPRERGRRLWRYLPYLIAAGINFMLRTYAIGGFAPLKRHPELSNYGYFINIFPLFSRYLEKLILPLNLNAYYVLHPASSVFEWRVMLSVIITLSFILGAYFLRRVNRAAFFSLLWIAVPILPVLYIPALGENTFADRYLYLPSAGFVILLTLLLERIYYGRKFWRHTLSVAISILVVIIGLYCAGTVKRNTVWKDNYTLWLDAVEKSPDDAIPHGSLANAYFGRGLIDKAVEHYEIALRLKPGFFYGHTNLAIAYQEKGLIDKAVGHYKIALRLRPDYPEPYNNLGIIYARQGLFDEAIAEFETAVRLEPRYAEAQNNLGLAYQNKGWTDRAIGQYKTALTIKPDYPQVHNNLGMAYEEEGRLAEAIEEYGTALRLKSDYANAHYNMGDAYYKEGRFDEAIKEFQMTLELEPGNSEALKKVENIKARSK
ncbi:MAG: tetratricopeptide repeat protein [Deltaproteobacteria bacterium]|nr:tetratricopeptide repeat protein [Deltaproteobacteria bacterium]